MAMDDGDKWRNIAVLTRIQAKDILKGSDDGTYLIRHSEKGGSVLCFQYKNNTSHVKITQRSSNNINNNNNNNNENSNKNNNNNDKEVFITDVLKFPNLDELLEHYAETSLGVHFPSYPVKLTNHIVIRYVVAQFSWEARNEKEISFETGDVISVIRDDGNWWYGFVNRSGKKGFFPSNYVSQNV